MRMTILGLVLSVCGCDFLKPATVRCESVPPAVTAPVVPAELEPGTVVKVGDQVLGTVQAYGTIKPRDEDPHQWEPWELVESARWAFSRLTSTMRTKPELRQQAREHLSTCLDQLRKHFPDPEDETAQRQKPDEAQS